MSWDVMVFNFGGRTAPPIEEVQDADLVPLGPAPEVCQRMSSHLPKIDWSDTTWGILEGDGYSIEFNVGKNDPITNMMLHVRGGGDAIAAIATFARPLGWSVFDCSTGEYLDLNNPSQAGWEGFQAFRDKFVEQYRDGEPG